MSNDFEREIGLLAAEIRKDDETLTEAQACELARVIILDLYRLALSWDQAAAAQRSRRVETA